MGIHDRDWYREEQRLRRQRERDASDRSASWSVFRSGALSTVINCLAVYGALHLILRLVRWASG